MTTVTPLHPDVHGSTPLRRRAATSAPSGGAPVSPRGGATVTYLPGPVVRAMLAPPPLGLLFLAVSCDWCGRWLHEDDAVGSHRLGWWHRGCVR